MKQSKDENEAKSKKGWFGKLIDKIDRKMEEKAKNSKCCGGSDSSEEPSKGSSCC